MITWFSKNEKPMVATISKNCITVNKPSLSYLKEAAAVELGYDDETKTIVMKPLTLGECESGIYPEDALFPLSGGKTYSRISSTEFVKKIGSEIGIDFSSTSHRFVTTYDTERRFVVIHLTEEAD